MAHLRRIPGKQQDRYVGMYAYGFQRALNGTLRQVAAANQDEPDLMNIGQPNKTFDKWVMNQVVRIDQYGKGFLLLTFQQPEPVKQFHAAAFWMPARRPPVPGQG